MTLKPPIRYTDKGNIRGRRTRTWGGHQSEFWYCDSCKRRQMEPAIARDRATRPRCKRCGELIHPLREFETLPTGERKRRCRICRCFLRSGNEAGICAPCQNREDESVEPRALPATTKDMNKVPLMVRVPDTRKRPATHKETLLIYCLAGDGRSLDDIYPHFPEEVDRDDIASHVRRIQGRFMPDENQPGDDQMKTCRPATREEQEQIYRLIGAGLSEKEVCDRFPGVNRTSITNRFRHAKWRAERSGQGADNGEYQQKIGTAADLMVNIMETRKADPHDGFPWYTRDDLKRVSDSVGLDKHRRVHVMHAAREKMKLSYLDHRTPQNAEPLRRILRYAKNSFDRKQPVALPDLRNNISLFIAEAGITHQRMYHLMRIAIEKIKAYRLVRVVNKLSTEVSVPPAPEPEDVPAPVSFEPLRHPVHDSDFPGTEAGAPAEETVYFDSNAFAVFVETVDNGYVVTIRTQDGTKHKKVFSDPKQFLGGNILSLFDPDAKKGK